MENDIKLLKINEIITEKFIIPSYQRGYRWGKRQINELLNDIWEFYQQERKADEFYCLQPVVVKKNNDKWEIIDGQQRLTTIYVILYYLRKNKFNIEFETKDRNSDFLNKIDESDKSNIDFFYIAQAHRVIREWFTNKEVIELENTAKDEFAIALGKFTKIIWYEISEYISKSYDIDIFTRLNIGKIPLTNSELVKALFLQKTKFDNGNVDEFGLKQIRIANEWDRIEYTLQDDEFWNFINKDAINIPNRIEFIFDAMARKISKDDEFFTFRFFANKLEKDYPQQVWDDVKKYFSIFEDWFTSRELYHLIGYLIICGEKVEHLKDAYESRNKSEFKVYINDHIKKYVNYRIHNLAYGTNNNEIRRVLLLFNIITILKMKTHYYRFSFSSYKSERWSIEHIHAQNADDLITSKRWIAWIEDHKKSLSRINKERYKKIISEMETISEDNVNSTVFNRIYIAVQDCLKDQFSDDMHLINNLTLLDKDMNSRLNNSFFDVKRSIIVEMDKEGSFIPPCTKNVFLKYYSENASHLYFWGPDDRQDYYKAIINTLKDYLPMQTEEHINEHN